MRHILLISLGLLCVAGLAQAPVPDAVIVANNQHDSQVGAMYGLKVASTQDKGRVIVVRNGIWGMDGADHVRFQLFTDGTLHLFDANFNETVTIDGTNGQLIVNGKLLAGPESAEMPGTRLHASTWRRAGPN